MANYEPSPLVLDLGSSMIKAGFAGDDAPRSVYPSVVGSSRCPAVQCGMGAKLNYVGDEAQAKRGILSLRYPIEHGMVTDWDALDVLLSQAFFNELAVAPEEHPILVSEHPLSPTQDQWMMCQRMFEMFNVPAYFAMPAPVLAMYSSARSSAINVDIGDGVLTIMPMHYGYTFPQCIRRVNFSGRDLTHYMTRLLMDQGHYLTRTSDFETVRELKEKLCYVALDFEEELHKSLVSTQLRQKYEMPDGQIIELDSERFTCPEALYQPSLVGREGLGVHELLYDAISSADKDLQRDFLGMIVVTGGSTMFPGFADRLQKEISLLAPASMKCRIIAPPERKYSVWIGGSIVASLNSFQSRWIMKTEYDEVGPNMVFRKSAYSKSSEFSRPIFGAGMTLRTILLFMYSHKSKTMDDQQRETLIDHHQQNDENNEDLINGFVSDIDIKSIIKKVRHFALINEDNKFCYVNRRFCQLFGYQRNEIIGQNIRDLYGELTESSPKEKISKGLTSHKEKSTSLILYRKDKVPIEVFVRLSPLKQDPDTVAFHLLTVIPGQLPNDYELFSPSSPNLKSPSKVRSAAAEPNATDAGGKDVVISLQRNIKIEDVSPMDLEWDISYGVDIKLPKETRCGKSKTIHRKILHSVRACAKPGELLAIMGPTGCGKTTLLNILAQRVRRGVKGQLYANGEVPNKNYKRKVGYVLQSDIFFENLTVEQTLNFQAAMRLPAELTDEERKTKVKDVMEVLGITKTRNTVIGGYARRGISGGEKKRVNIGNQLLTNPSVLFLDEPTTGLDTSTALSLMLSLKEMARAGMTIVATIHQPSSQIFEQFDKLLLMVDGNTVYFGAANSAISYFSSIGLRCPKNYNPADFMMGLVLEEEIKQEDVLKKKIIKDWQEYQSDSKKFGKQFKYLTNDTNGNGVVDHDDSSEIESKQKQKQKVKKDYARSWGDQFKTLWLRAIIQSKGVYFETIQYIQLALVVLIVSILWLQTPAREDRINDIVGVMFFLAIYNIGFFPMLCSLFNFPPERDVIIRERSEGAYYLSAYFAAKALSDMPFLILYPFAYVIPTYFLVGLAYDAGKFFYFLLLIMVGSITATGFGLMFSAGFPDVRKSQVFATVAMLFILLAGGFYINMDLIPPWFSWLQYLSYLKYALDSLVISQFTGATFEQTPLVTQFDGYNPIPGELVIASRSLTVPSMWGSFGVVIGWGIAFWSVAFVLLKNSLKPRN